MSIAGREGVCAVRQGLRIANGLSENDGKAIVAARKSGPFASVEDIWRRARIPAASLTKLADADAFQSLGLKRRDAIWAIKGLRDEPLPLFAAADDRDRQLRSELVEPTVSLTPMTDGREVVEDYRSKGISLRAHPLSFVRADLAAQGCVTCADLAKTPNGRRILVAGLVLVRQKPGSAKGVMFITLEDETDIANLIVWPKVFARERLTILSSRMMAVEGRIQRASNVMHVIVERVFDRSNLLHAISGRDGGFHLPHGRGDEAKSGGGPYSRDSDPMRRKPRDILVPNLHIHHGEMKTIKIKARNFQ